MLRAPRAPATRDARNRQSARLPYLPRTAPRLRRSAALASTPTATRPRPLWPSTGRPIDLLTPPKRLRAHLRTHTRHSAIYPKSGVLASRARAAARACSCTILTSIAWMEHMRSSEAQKCTHPSSHASQQRHKSRAPQPPHSLRELDSHLSLSLTSAAAREGRGRRGDIIEDCRARREVVIARGRSAFSILACVTRRTGAVRQCAHVLARAQRKG